MRRQAECDGRQAECEGLRRLVTPLDQAVRRTGESQFEESGDFFFLRRKQEVAGLSITKQSPSGRESRPTGDMQSIGSKLVRFSEPAVH